jgi:hypothetical protein
MRIGYSKGPITNKNVDEEIITWDGIIEKLQHPQIGTKDGSYICRCAFRHNERSDQNALQGEFLVLDGDSRFDPQTGAIYPSAPDPILVHEVLGDLDICHAIYSSHSNNGNDKIKYRVLIPAPVADKDELQGMVTWVIDQLHQHGVWLENVRENMTFSQAWFVPRIEHADRRDTYVFLSHDGGQDFPKQTALDWWAAQKPQQAIPELSKQPRHVPDENSPIGRFNKQHGIDWMLKCLIENGYVFNRQTVVNDSPAYRLISPTSESGTPGVSLFFTEREVWRVYSFHGNHDPLAGKASDAFELFTLFFHKGDQTAALEALSEQATDYGVDLAMLNSDEQFDMNWMEEFTVSEEEADEIANPQWIIENLVIQGHLIVVPAEPNGGKTTIFWEMSKQMVERGFKVCYVNADISGGDAKSMIYEAKEYGITLMLPDMKVGKSMTDVINNLVTMNESAVDFSQYVFVFDTLKKMTDVINKKLSKQLYRLLRSLSAKGMTIILLAHTNKYKGENNEPIYEGTGDLRSDVDEMIYLVPVKNPDGSLTVSTIPDKKRCVMEPITFHISSQREVTIQTKYVDTVSENIHRLKLTQDRPVIEAITEILEKGTYKQVDIIDYCKQEHSIGKRTVQTVLARYDQNGEYRQFWEGKKGFQHNAIFYSLLEKGAP